MNKSVVVHVPLELGGVRNVTENLANEMIARGWHVRKVSSLTKFIYFGLFEKNDFSITSLSFGLFAFLYKKSIYILHGFPMVDIQPLWKRIFLRLIPKVAKKMGVQLVAVSHLTKSMYQRIYGVKVDAVIHNGVSDIFFNSTPKYKKNKVILYLGRLVKGKGVDDAIRAFDESRLFTLGYEFHVVGSGPLAAEFHSLSLISPWLVFHGSVNEDVKLQLMRNAEIFVSLNDFEPMGVVFAEALLCDCKIIAPFVGGFREFIPLDYSAFYCDPSDLNSIISSYEKAIKSNYSAGSLRKNYFNYAEIVDKYLDAVES
jgi:glycosyltransferase involved in cell wall biosynthesis